MVGRRKAPFRAVFDAAVRPVYVAGRDRVISLVERHHGIETQGTIELAELGLDSADRERYKPTEWLTLPRILRRREVDPGDVFIDFGSGLGRVVYQAALRYPFKRVIGLELSDKLNAVAKQNIDRNRTRLRCHAIELLTADALDYEIPYDVTVAFFANPFQGPVFETVIERLLQSIDRHPRSLRLIYRNPVEHAYLMSTGRFRPIRHLRGMRPTPEWSRSNSTTMYVAGPRLRDEHASEPRAPDQPAED